MTLNGDSPHLLIPYPRIPCLCRHYGEALKSHHPTFPWEAENLPQLLYLLLLGEYELPKI